MDALSIAGAFSFTPSIHHDSRGSFHEYFRGAEFCGDLGYQFSLSQVNCSVSRRGVIRGIHFTAVPPGQAKYVMCVSGAITDVVVDLRTGSPTYRAWEAVRLDDENRSALFLAEGLGHGFVSLTEEATVLYLCSTPYAPGIEHGVHPLDPAIGIDWPLDGDAILSAKDAAAPKLADAEQANMLPSYAACLDYAAGLRTRPAERERPG